MHIQLHEVNGTMAAVITNSLHQFVIRDALRFIFI
jgi:hypothetical protein